MVDTFVHVSLLNTPSLSLTESVGEAHPELCEDPRGRHRQATGTERARQEGLRRRVVNPAVPSETHPVAD